MPSISSLIRFSWSKTKEILLPFQLKRWLKILFIVWLAGASGSGNWGNNFSPPARQPSADEQVQDENQEQRNLAQETNRDNLTPLASEPLDDTRGIPQGAPATDPALDSQTQDTSRNFPIALMIVMVPLILIIALVFMWLSARFNFIFLELLTRRDISIVESFRAHKASGNSYFLWSLGFIGVAIGCVLLAGLLAAALFAVSKPLVWLMIPVFIVLVVFFALVGLFVHDFVVPMMYQDQIHCMDACRKFLSFRPEMGSLAIYVLLMIGLGIAAGIIAMVVGLVVAVTFVIAGLIVGVIGALIVGLIPILKPVLVVFGILLFIAAVLAMIVFIGFITLPIPIFFRAFSLVYLTRLIPSYNLLGFSSSDSEPPPNP